MDSLRLIWICSGLFNCWVSFEKRVQVKLHHLSPLQLHWACCTRETHELLSSYAACLSKEFIEGKHVKGVVADEESEVVTECEECEEQLCSSNTTSVVNLIKRISNQINTHKNDTKELACPVPSKPVIWIVQSPGTLLLQHSIKFQPLN